MNMDDYPYDDDPDPGESPQKIADAEFYKMRPHLKVQDLEAIRQWEYLEKQPQMKD